MSGQDNPAEKQAAAAEKTDPAAVGDGASAAASASTASTEAADPSIGPSGPAIDFKANEIRLDGSIVAGELNQTTNHYHGPAESNGPSRLRPHNFRWLDPQDMLKRRKSLLFDPAEIERWTEALATQRVLILCGEPELGKTCLAEALAAGLQRRFPSLAGAGLCRALDGSMRIYMDDLLGDEPQYHGRTLILRHAFDAAGLEMQAFTSRLAKAPGNFLDRLQHNDSFLILTTDANPPEGPELHRAELQWNVPRPPTSFLVAALRGQALAMTQHPRCIANPRLAGLIESWISTHGETAAERIGTLPRIDRFARHHLIAVAAGDVELLQALDDLDDLGRWLLQDLPQDLPAWCAALSLTLCTPSPVLTWAPWLPFEQMRYEIEGWIRRQMKRDREPRDLADLFRGSRILEQARATVVRSSFPSAHRVHFVDERYGNKAWTVLTSEGRDVLTMLLLGLMRVAAGSDTGLARCAAGALGRGGQIDPLRIVLPLMTRWAREERHELLGSLLQGIAGSDDPEYAAGCCMRWLHALLYRDTAKVAPTAAAALRKLAAVAPSGVLRELKELAQERFEPQWSYLRAGASKVADIQVQLRAIKDPKQSALALKDLGRRIPQWLNQWFLPEELRRLVDAFEFALGGVLWDAADLAEAFVEVTGWLRAEPEGLGPLVTLLFLRPDGIASQLRPEPDNEHTMGDDPATDWLREVLDATAAAVQAFLIEVFRQLRAFPGVFRGLLTDEYRSLLASWAAAGHAGRVPRTTMVALLAGLFNGGDEELSHEILRMAKEPRPNAGRGELRDLAIEAVTGRATATASNARGGRETGPAFSGVRG